MENKKRNKKSGFTLIELVVVIAIIGVLAAVVTPRVRLSLSKAKDSKAIATLEALRTASNVYYAEKGVPVFATGTALTAVTNTEIQNLIDAKYLDTNAIKQFTDGKIEVGSLSTVCSGTNPTTLNPGQSIQIYKEADGIGLVFTQGTATFIDTGCKPWADK